MKQILLAAVMMLLLAASVSAATTSGTQPIIVQLSSYQPVPARPGDLVDAFVLVANDGSGDITNLEVESLKNNIFSPEGRSLYAVDTLDAGRSYTARFKVRVATDAQPGERLLQIRTRQGSSEWQETSVNITIRTDDAAVFITDVDTVPDVIQPGKNAELRLKVENLVASRLRDVSVNLDLSNSPFIPLEGTSRQKISSLGPLAERDFGFMLGVKPSAVADTYRIPVTVSFLDEFGITKNSTDTIGVVVNTEAETKAFIDDVAWTNGDLQVTLRLVNKGLSEVKFVEANIGEGNGYDIPSQERNSYVGNIDSDDWETVRFKIATESTGEVSIPITYSYRDAFNERHEISETFTVDVPERKSENSAAGPITILVIVLIVGFFWWRNRRKKAKR